MASASQDTTSRSPRSLARGEVVTTVLKYQSNKVETNPNKMLSRTCGKVVVIDQAWLDVMQNHIEFPKHDEWWLVDIVKETLVGTNRGVLISHPRRALLRSELARLVPGMYTEEMQGGVLYVRPKHIGPYWILPMQLRESLGQTYHNPTSIIVPLDLA